MRRSAATARVLLLVALLAASPAFAQSPAAQPATPPAAGVPVAAPVVLSGEGLETLSFSAADLAAMPRVTVDADDHGTRARFEGVPVSVLLAKAKAPIGEARRHGRAALVVLVGAADGYNAVYALAELDPAFTDKEVILADRRDGKPLGEKEGPFRVVAPGEKRQARWVRQVTSLTLLQVGEDKAHDAAPAAAPPAAPAASPAAVHH